MQQIDEPRLETDLHYRFHFLADFIGFGPEDESAIQEAAVHLGPLLAALVEKTYEKLLSFDATARHFLPRQHGYTGPLPEQLKDLSQNHAQIRFRKDHLQRYFMNLLGRSYDARMVEYLDMAGKIHTTRAGNKEIEVPLVQMNALMGLLSDILLETVSGLGLDQGTMLKTIRAFNKILWIQNDLISRHYQPAPVQR